jgi:uncharacterized repeat protein (TIGR01451 family)
MKRKLTKTVTAGAATVLLFPTLVMGQCLPPNDVLISDPAQDFVDPEFDPVGNQLVWADFSGNVWIADVDPVNGDITPNDGKGTLVDTDFLRETINGPEWSYDRGKPYAILTKPFFDKPQLWVAREDTPGNWSSTALQHTIGRFNPNGTSSSSQDEGRIVYGQRDQNAIAWRIGDKANTEDLLLGVKGLGGRQIEGRRSWMVGDIVAGTRQILGVDIDSGQVTQITSGPEEKTTWHSWWAPEFNEPVIVTRHDTQTLAIYRENGGAWTLHYTFNIPNTNFPYLSSPEGFSWNGKSYVAVVAARALNPNAAVPAAPTGPSQIWIAGIDPADPFFCKISAPGRLSNLSDPEVFPTDNGPVVFYSEIIGKTYPWRLRRADTGLGPRAPGVPDLAVQTIGAVDSIELGNVLNHTVRVINNGTGLATGVVVENVLPANASFDSASPSCTLAAGTVSCALGTLAAGAETTVEISLFPNSGDILLNTATVSANEIEDSLADNSSTEETELTGGPAPSTYRLNVVPFNGPGSIVSTPEGIDCPGACTADFTNGQAVVLTATPDAGSMFVKWFGACISAGSNPDCSLNMNKDRWAYAAFQ